MSLIGRRKFNRGSQTGVDMSRLSRATGIRCVPVRLDVEGDELMLHDDVSATLVLNATTIGWQTTLVLSRNGVKRCMTMQPALPHDTLDKYPMRGREDVKLVVGVDETIIVMYVHRSGSLLEHPTCSSALSEYIKYIQKTVDSDGETEYDDSDSAHPPAA